MNCPRCDTTKGDARWCDVCGFDFAPELGRTPTAEAYTSGAKEQRWLAEHPEDAQRVLEEQREAERANVAARVGGRTWVRPEGGSAISLWVIPEVFLGLLFWPAAALLGTILLVKGARLHGVVLLVAAGIGLVLSVLVAAVAQPPP
jgi:hypothetical protein